MSTPEAKGHFAHTEWGPVWIGSTSELATTADAALRLIARLGRSASVR